MQLRAIGLLLLLGLVMPLGACDLGGGGGEGNEQIEGGQGGDEGNEQTEGGQGGEGNEQTEEDQEEED